MCPFVDTAMRALRIQIVLYVKARTARPQQIPWAANTKGKNVAHLPFAVAAYAPNLHILRRYFPQCYRYICIADA